MNPQQTEFLSEIRRLAENNFTSNGMCLGDIHGTDHWDMVGKTASILLEYHGHNPLVGRLFGLLHDCCREDDFDSPNHGREAAQFAHGISNLLREHISHEELDQLIWAMSVHDTDVVPGEADIAGCCLDADRLDIARVGCNIDPGYLSTWSARVLVNNGTSIVNRSGSSLRTLFHGSTVLDGCTRLHKTRCPFLYLTPSRKIASDYGDVHKVLVALDSHADLTDPGGIVLTPIGEKMREIQRRWDKEGKVHRVSGEPLDLFTVLAAGSAYEEDPQRYLCEDLVGEIMSLGYDAIRINEDGHSHQDKETGEPIPTWMLGVETNTIIDREYT